jgi:hypothetical protein
VTLSHSAIASSPSSINIGARDSLHGGSTHDTPASDISPHRSAFDWPHVPRTTRPHRQHHRHLTLRSAPAL